MPCHRLQNDLLEEEFSINGKEFPEFDVNDFRVYNPEDVQKYLEKHDIEELNPERVVKEYKRREKRFLERNDVFKFLKQCSEEFGTIGFISDNSLEGKEWFKNLLEENDVPYDVLLVSDEIGVEKPDPRIFEEFLERRGEPAEKFVYIGNNVERDSAAEKVGMGFIWAKKFEDFGSSYDGVSVEDLTVENLKEAMKEVEL